MTYKDKIIAGQEGKHLVIQEQIMQISASNIIVTEFWTMSFVVAGNTNSQYIVIRLA